MNLVSLPWALGGSGQTFQPEPLEKWEGLAKEVILCCMGLLASRTLKSLVHREAGGEMILEGHTAVTKKASRFHFNP